MFHRFKLFERIACCKLHVHVYTIVIYPSCLLFTDKWAKNVLTFQQYLHLRCMSIFQSGYISNPGFIYRRLLTKMTFLNQDVLVIKMKTSRSSQITKDIFLCHSHNSVLFSSFMTCHQIWLTIIFYKWVVHDGCG